MMTNEILKEIFSKGIGSIVSVKGSAAFRESGGNQMEHFVNYSRILTILIQEAGRVCADYASDLFISWESLLVEVEKKMKEKANFTLTTFFGFREQGVDGPLYITEKITNENVYGDPYASIYRLDVNAKHSIDIAGESDYAVELILFPVYRTQMLVPTYMATKRDGTKIKGYLLPEGFGSYLIPEEGITLQGTEKAEVLLVSVFPDSIRRF